MSADTAYTFYVIARDAAGNSSTASAPVTFRTAAGQGDTVAPTRPGTPVASAVTSSGGDADVGGLDGRGGCERVRRLP
ncbi:hypothetical protein GCM10017559_43340 [Streptosporangium longisporum]|uniref:Fibronectin type-III domain-containing protein n=1 Tax=Streptosporangium longisporum TaxID=46187 RepID=A0ABP6KND6_9ACTN